MTSIELIVVGLSRCALCWGLVVLKMSGCQLTCAASDHCKRCKEAKRIVEGECCALAYDDDGDWFDDEDEEFCFGETGWFEEAFVSGLSERYEMLNAYKTMERTPKKKKKGKGKESKKSK
jgi:hypothetical protein